MRSGNLHSCFFSIPRLPQEGRLVLLGNLKIPGVAVLNNIFSRATGEKSHPLASFQIIHADDMEMVIELMTRERMPACELDPSFLWCFPIWNGTNISPSGSKRKL